MPQYALDSCSRRHEGTPALQHGLNDLECVDAEPGSGNDDQSGCGLEVSPMSIETRQGPLGSWPWTEIFARCCCGLL